MNDPQRFFDRFSASRNENGATKPDHGMSP